MLYLRWPIFVIGDVRIYVVINNGKLHCIAEVRIFGNLEHTFNLPITFEELRNCGLIENKNKLTIFLLTSSVETAENHVFQWNTR